MGKTTCVPLKKGPVQLKRMSWHLLEAHGKYLFIPRCSEH